MSFTLMIGQAVPDVEAEAYVRDESEPRTIRLSDYHGRWLVLFFYPRDFTFICPKELTAFGALAEEFEAENATVVGASTDSYYSHKAWFEGDEGLAQVTYPVLADTTHALARSGCWPLTVRPTGPPS